MKVVSIINDGLLHAKSILLEMTISEYLGIGTQILHNNRYQRRRIKNGPAMYSLLSRDLLHLCTMPPIVLAFGEQELGHDIEIGTTNEELRVAFSNNNLLILDGLQRTYTMMGVEESLLTEEQLRDAFLNHIIRVEVYSGLSRTGILYRMLTLNSGQTPMSKRHQIEILYSHFRNDRLGNIEFILQTDLNAKIGIDQYDFDDAIEGFNSFINADESPIDKYEIRVIAERLEKITNDDYQKDIFERFMLTYNAFVHRINELSDSWEYRDSHLEVKKSIFGRDIAHFFCKSQTISAFGAALGYLMESELISSLDDVKVDLETVAFGYDVRETFNIWLSNLEEIRKQAPKIGVEQRLYLRMFFESLFSPHSDSRLLIKASVDKSFTQYKQERWKQDIAEQTTLF